MQMSPSRTILHLSDTHLLPTPEDRLHGVDTFDNLRSIVDVVVESGTPLDAIVVSGDLANGGEVDSYRRLRLGLADAEAQLGVPLLVAIGNHDSRSGFREGYLGEPASETPYDYTRMIGGLRFCILDSSIPGQPHGELDEAQLSWLRHQLNAPAPEGTILVLHHPPVQGPVPLINLLMLRNAEQLEEVIGGTDVLAVLGGHVHHPTAASFGGVLCFAAPASAYTVDPLSQGNGFRGVEGPGFGLVQVYGRRVVASAIALPTAQRELYRYDLSDEQVRRWSERATGAVPVGRRVPVAVGGRVLPLAGTYNLRDLGGYPTEDGRTTRWRTLFRSDALHRLSADAQAELLGLGLRTVIDLRHERELADCPNVFAASQAVRYVNVPLLSGRSAVPDNAPSWVTPTLSEIYRTIVDQCGPRLAAVFAALTEPGALPGLVHCTAGKDRTGVIVALALRLAGVPAETVAADYAVTEGQIAGEFIAEHRQAVEARGVEWASYQGLMACQPELMLDLLAYIDSTYDGVEPYLMQVGLSVTQLDALRTVLVE
jgi:3',5'-cyclic-AMP phosphodiesterase